LLLGLEENPYLQDRLCSLQTVLELVLVGLQRGNLGEQFVEELAGVGVAVVVVSRGPVAQEFVSGLSW
jgi:hypothetical protein